MKKKRILKYGAIVLIALILALAAILAITFAPLKSAPVFQTSNGMQFVSDGASTIGIVPTSANKVLLVDSGMDTRAVAVLAELSKLGMNADSVTAILFTHGHYDHIGGAKQFPHAQLMALGAEANLISGSAGSHGPVTRLLKVSPTGLKLTRALKDGETLTVGKTEIKVFAVPGHTMGSAAYLINGVLFLGDSAVSTSSGKLQHAIWMFSDDMRANDRSLRALESRLRESSEPVHAIAFGHSAILQQGLTPLTEWAQGHAE